MDYCAADRVIFMLLGRYVRDTDIELATLEGWGPALVHERVDISFTISFRTT